MKPNFYLRRKQFVRYLDHFPHKSSYSAIVLTLILLSCTEDDDLQLPTSADIFYSVVDKQAAFTALANSASSYSWSFGDGTTSTEKNPVHVYESGGYYTVILSVQGKTGTDADTAQLAVDLTPYVLLTGGPTDVDGKTWKLSGAHPKDKFADADADLSGVVDPLPSGVFGSIGLGEVYEDEFTFHFDGTYEHDVKGDNAAFAGYVHQLMLNGGADIVNGNATTFEYDLCTAKYTPEAGATFTFTESEDFAVPSVYGPSPNYLLTYGGVSTLSFSGTEFIGFMDAQRKVIVQEVQDGSMRLVMFVAASPDYHPFATHALVLTFEVVE